MQNETVTNVRIYDDDDDDDDDDDVMRKIFTCAQKLESSLCQTLVTTLRITAVIKVSCRPVG